MTLVSERAINQKFSASSGCFAGCQKQVENGSNRLLDTPINIISSAGRRERELKKSWIFTQEPRLG